MQVGGHAGSPAPAEMYAARHLCAGRERRAVQVFRGYFGEFGRERGFKAAWAREEEIEGH